MPSFGSSVSTLPGASARLADCPLRECWGPDFGASVTDRVDKGIPYGELWILIRDEVALALLRDDATDAPPVLAGRGTRQELAGGGKCGP